MKSVKIEKPIVVEFSYFLDAWQFCQENDLNWNAAIQKKNFRTWIVVY